MKTETKMIKVATAGNVAAATQRGQAKIDEQHRYRVIWKQWDKSKTGDRTELVENGTKWMSLDACIEWINTHWCETHARIIDRTGEHPDRCFGNSEQDLSPDKKDTSV